jgi:isopentenyl diphosphate isomerase/L-lactate dehydrogenase-like FMN-dependent dehydrogenase
MNHDTFHGNVRSYTTIELIDQLYANLRVMAPQCAESAYIAGYLHNTLKEVAENGVDALVSTVDWTNQQVEAKRNMLEKIAN